MSTCALLLFRRCASNSLRGGRMPRVRLPVAAVRQRVELGQLRADVFAKAVKRFGLGLSLLRRFYVVKGVSVSPVGVGRSGGRALTAWLSHSSNRRLGHEWATDCCQSRQQIVVHMQPPPFVRWTARRRRRMIVAMVRTLPTGVVTLLFTDVEGSTRLLHELGDDYGEALHEHRRRLRAVFVDHEGVEVDTQGDAFFVAFARASNAVAAATDAPARTCRRADTRADGAAHGRASADGRGLRRARRAQGRAYRRRRARRAGAPVADDPCTR